MPTTIDQQKAPFLSALQQEIPTGDSVRQQAADALSHLEVPTRKWEEWKYTAARDLVSKTFTGKGQPIESVDPFFLPNLDGDRMVFINGVFAPEHSSLGANGDQIQLAPLGQLNEVLEGVYDSHFGELVGEDNVFTAANTAYAHEGVVLFVPNGQVAEHPIQIVHLHSSKGETLPLQHRNLFLVGKNASAKLVETYFSDGDGASFRNQVDEVQVLENGELEYVKLQSESDQSAMVGHTSVRLGRDSRFKIFTLTFSGELVRNDLYLKLDGENVSAELYGAYLLDGLQHVDNHTRVDHAMPNCYSNELYKGIISDRATAVFNGYIHVYPDAQKTNAFQSNRNILLSENANIYTKPQLEIYADDVKCSHGATTGRIDDAALFYLRARGIPELEAKKMMIHAFTMETVENLTLDPVRAYIEERVTHRF